MIHAFNTKRGNVHLEFFQRRKQTGYSRSDSTKVRRTLSMEKPNRAVLIRKVPLDVTDEMIQRCLDTQFTDAKTTRFIKRDSTKIGTVKIMLKSENDLGKALQQGLFINYIYYKTRLFVQNVIQIVNCFKCQKLGYISAKCQSAEKYGHCKENHLFRHCPNKNQESKHAKCNLKHPANYTQCDVYIQQF